MQSQVYLYDIIDRETSNPLLTNYTSREEAREAKRELELRFDADVKIRQRKYSLVDAKVIR